MLDIVTTESPRFTMLDIVTTESPRFTMLDIVTTESHWFTMLGRILCHSFHSIHISTNGYYFFSIH
jgi:hypothetical protein